MNYYNHFTEYQGEEDAVVSFGKYDGLHLGHQLLINKIREVSCREGLKSIVGAFNMSSSGKLMTPDERRVFLEGKVDALIECPFDDALRTLEAESFITNIVSHTLHARYVVVGTDFQFGHMKKGDVDLLKAFEDKCNYKTIVVKKMKCRDTIISSTVIKSFVQEGNLNSAAEFLGYQYSVSGVVERGNRLGRKLGFPTINVPWPMDKLCIPYGVYFCQVYLDGLKYHSICNVGVKPTVESDGRVLAECFIMGYDGDAYDRPVKIEFLDFHRPEVRFFGIEELKKQIIKDICDGEKYFGVL